MILTYDQIHKIYFYDNNSVIIDMAVENKFKVDLNKNTRCLNCGTKVSKYSWLCPGNDHACIISFFSKNPELLVEAITHAS